MSAIVQSVLIVAGVAAVVVVVVGIREMWRAAP